MSVTLLDYFERAVRIRPVEPSGVAGERCLDGEGNSAVFWIAADARGQISLVSYRCTTCFTLVALCEHLAELVNGATLRGAGGWTPERLLSIHPEVPVSRQGRAGLAVSALLSAVRNSGHEVSV